MQSSVITRGIPARALPRSLIISTRSRELDLVLVQVNLCIGEYRRQLRLES
jgi:hypothetical protein